MSGHRLHRAAALCLAALAAASAAPAAYAQLIVGDVASHDRLEITINEDGTAHVLHEVRRSASPVTMVSVEGEHENLVMTDAAGNTVQHAVSQNENSFGVTIFGSGTNTIIEYDLLDAVSRVGAYSTWDYRYLETTLFVMPQSVERVYINGGPVDFEGDARKIECHGCEARLEYAPEEETGLDVRSDGAVHAVGFRTAEDIAGAEFDAGAGALVVEVDSEAHAFVTATIPHALLEPPYEVYQADERLIARAESQNATHTELRTRVPESGTIGIFGGAGEGKVAEPEASGAGLAPLALVAAGAAGIAVSVALWRRRRGRT